MLKSEIDTQTTPLGFQTSNFTIHTSSILALDLRARQAPKHSAPQSGTTLRRRRPQLRSALTQINIAAFRNRSHEPSISRRRSVMPRCSLQPDRTSRSQRRNIQSYNCLVIFWERVAMRSMGSFIQFCLPLRCKRTFGQFRMGGRNTLQTKIALAHHPISLACQADNLSIDSVQSFVVPEFLVDQRILKFVVVHALGLCHSSDHFRTLAKLPSGTLRFKSNRFEDIVVVIGHGCVRTLSFKE